MSAFTAAVLNRRYRKLQVGPGMVNRTLFRKQPLTKKLNFVFHRKTVPILPTITDLMWVCHLLILTLMELCTIGSKLTEKD